MKRISSSLSGHIFHLLVGISIFFLGPSAKAAENIPLVKDARIEALEKLSRKLLTYETDLGDIARGLRGTDQEFAISLMDQADKISIYVEHFQDLLEIEPLVHGDQEKLTFKFTVSMRVKSTIVGIDGSLKLINRGLAYVQSQAVIATANNLKEDIRAFRALLPN